MIVCFQIPEESWHIRPPQQGLAKGEDIHHVAQAGWSIGPHLLSCEPGNARGNHSDKHKMMQLKNITSFPWMWGRGNMFTLKWSSYCVFP